MEQRNVSVTVTPLEMDNEAASTDTASVAGDDSQNNTCTTPTTESNGQVEDEDDNTRAERRVLSPPHMPSFMIGQRREEPKTGTNMPMCPSPIHVGYCTEHEPLIAPPSSLADAMQARDSERYAHPELSNNVVVYDCIDTNPAHVRRGPPPRDDKGELLPYWTVDGNEDTTLVFESRFEGGNLRRAIQVSEYEYDLVLRPDVNTFSQAQWYYFRVTNTRTGRKYRFNIVNLQKPTSLYNHGLKPLLYSETNSARRGVGWRRGGSDIAYYVNGIKKRGGGTYHTMTFSYVFEHDNDTVYMAYCYPFSYSDLQSYLADLEMDSVKRSFIRRRSLCQSLAGNTCEMLTITDFSSNLKGREGVVVCARVHPGETTGSWMVKGVIDLLTGDSDEAAELRRTYVFKIIPMLNPDGVINGNYRCSLAGVDLNRQWGNPSRKIHPTIYSAKQTIMRMQEDRNVKIFIDFHGHSRKHGVFCYGCENSSDPKLSLHERVLPRLLARRSPFFCYNYCNFRVQKSKESSARVSVRRQLNIVNSYTLEASVSGMIGGTHFSSNDYESVGADFCLSLIDLHNIEIECRTTGRSVLSHDMVRTMQPSSEIELEIESEGSDDEEEKMMIRSKSRPSAAVAADGQRPHSAPHTRPPKPRPTRTVKPMSSVAVTVVMPHVYDASKLNRAASVGRRRPPPVPTARVPMSGHELTITGESGALKARPHSATTVATRKKYRNKK